MASEIILQDPVLKGLVSDAGDLSKLLIGILGFAVVIIVVRLIKGDQVDLPLLKLRIPLRYATYFIVVLTVLHTFLTWAYVSQCRVAATAENKNKLLPAAYEEIKKTVWYPFNKLSDATLKKEKGAAYVVSISIRRSPGGVAIFVGTVLLFCSMLQLTRRSLLSFKVVVKRRSQRSPEVTGEYDSYTTASDRRLVWHTLLMILVAGAITWLNWMVGTHWVAATVALQDATTAVSYFDYIAQGSVWTLFKSSKVVMGL